MKSKVLLLATMYYCLMILASCCPGITYYVDFSSIKSVFNADNNRFDLMMVDPVFELSDDLLASGTIASLANFKAANATSCAEDLYFSLKYIEQVNITSDELFFTGVPPNQSLNQFFQIFTSGKKEYGFVSEYIGAVILKDSLPVDTITRTMYFEYKLNTGATIRDTVANVRFNN